MLRNLLLLILLPIAAVVGLASCDNVGRAFDPNLNPNDPGEETGISTIQIVPVGGEARDGRPLVRDAYPSGDGWPSTVPIVVTFSESLNEATILPTTVTGLDARIGVRVRHASSLFNKCKRYTNMLPYQTLYRLNESLNQGPSLHQAPLEFALPA